MNLFQQDYGQILLRWSMGLVFLIFGIMQIYAPTNWTGYLPDFITGSSSVLFVIVNGSVEIFLGLLIIFGLYTRIAAIILGVHLIGISVSLGFTALALRDWGIALATISIAFFDPDMYCFDRKRLNKIRTRIQ